MLKRLVRGRGTWDAGPWGHEDFGTRGRAGIRGRYLTVILRGRAGYELIYITNEAVGRVGYYQLISGKFEKNNCFSKFSSDSLDSFGRNLLKS